MSELALNNLCNLWQQIYNSKYRSCRNGTSMIPRIKIVLLVLVVLSINSQD